MVLWVFGYGSLIWRPGFNYDKRIICFIKDYKRVFHQGSIDHRGTIEKPGRTVTIQHSEGAVIWGAAFRVSDPDEEKIVMAYLDLRERAYDLKAFLDIYTSDSAVTPAMSGVLTYIATPGPLNLCYLGPASLKDMARQIATAHGPSGPNHEYLFRLEEALRQIGLEIGENCVDEEITILAREVQSILASQTPALSVMNSLNGRHLTMASNVRHLPMVKS